MTTLSEIKLSNLKSFENNPFIFSIEACRRLSIETRIDLTSTQSVTKFSQMKRQEKKTSRAKRFEVSE